MRRLRTSLRRHTFVWSFVVFFLSCVVWCCSCCVFVCVTCFSSYRSRFLHVVVCGVVHVVSCVVLFLLYVCVCDLFFFLQEPSAGPTHLNKSSSHIPTAPHSSARSVASSGPPPLASEPSVCFKEMPHPQCLKFLQQNSKSGPS